MDKLSRCFQISGIFVLAAILSNLGQASPHQIPTEREEQMDQLFDSYTGSRPGAAVAVFRGGEMVFAKGYGRRHLEQDEAVTLTSNFRLASVSKAFTAMAVMILLDRGLLSLETPLTDVFPDYPSYGARITMGHLLGHTSGLYAFEDLMNRYPTPRPIKDADVLQLMIDHSRSTYFTPGSSYRYSNTGYVLLAQVVERLSGKRFSEFLEDEVFVPLGMSQTVAFENGINTVPERAFGYAWQNGRYRDADQSDTSSTLGDGGVYTSVSDMLHWDRLWRGDGPALVSPEILAAATTPGRLNNGRQTSYGYGWSLGPYRGTTAVTHTGSTSGFRTAFQRYPEKDLSVVVLVNRAGASPWNQARQVADLFWND